MRTIETNIKVTEICCYLANNAIADAALFPKQQKVDPKLPTTLYIGAKVMRKIWSLDNNYDGLRKVSDYYYFLCAPFNARALAILNGGGSGIVVTPTTGDSSNTIWKLRIYSNNFTGTSNYDNPKIVGRSIEIYDNNNQKMLNRQGDAPDFGYTSTGIIFYNIDATGNSYDFTLFIEGGATGSAVTTPEQPPLIISILNEDTKVIDWTGDLKSKYGSFPDLQLFLFDTDSGEYQLSSIQPSINGTPDTFTTITYRGLGTTSNGWITVK